MAVLAPRVASVGVHSIDHFALEVPDLSAAKVFFGAFGLAVDETIDGLELRASASDHVWARVLKGSRKQLAYLSLNCFGDDLAALTAQVETAGGKPCAAHAGAHDPEGFWFEDPDGNRLQIRTGDKTSPGLKKAAVAAKVRRGLRGAAARHEAPAVHPTRLSHVLLFTPDIERAIQFYRDALGLKFSDGSKGIVAFMHGRHGSDHHLVAFVQSSAKGWHHSAWDVPTVEEVGLGKMQMARAGFVDGWGVGRHVLGSNHFHYVRDPWGSFCEYSADIDFVPPGVEWPSADHPPEDSLYLWGPDVPAYFIENTEAQR
ncbi:VOC family protein [Caballeronia zhejiangensis]|uniref:Metapyrocatechase n=2 Tax=Burkholderiaceae TaxID=119060 RepID=A0A656QEA4_9BURK|nr:VOC family protein [Caballeronia zhejiangensis]AET95603.1 mhqB [Burkholderia sp. YI23]KDR27162.1 metapyrocatechase [Caballeronia zhejiangensis]BAE46530.1 mhqB [Burkholderia sp. NF100]BBQ03243.1 glyoxalase [Burkholderia sp. SFA1]